MQGFGISGCFFGGIWAVSPGPESLQALALELLAFVIVARADNCVARQTVDLPWMDPNPRGTYCMYRVLEPLGPYIVCAWKVRVRFALGLWGCQLACSHEGDGTGFLGKQIPIGP